VTPERLEHLKELRKIRDDLEVLFKKARDNWTKACSDLNYALLEDFDYYQWMRGRTPHPPDWLAEVKGEKGAMTRKKADELVEKMLQQQKEPKKQGEKNAYNWKSLW